MCNFCEDIITVSKIPFKSDAVRERSTAKSAFYAGVLSCTPNKGSIGDDMFPRRPYPYTAITMDLRVNIVKHDGLFYLVAESNAVQGAPLSNPHNHNWDEGNTMVVSQVFYCPYCGEKLQSSKIKR